VKFLFFLFLRHNAPLAADVQGLLGEIFVFVPSFFTCILLALNHLACTASAASLLAFVG